MKLKLTERSVEFWMTLGGISTGVAVTGGLFAPWPVPLTLVQGAIAAACFYVGLEKDPRLQHR